MPRQHFVASILFFLTSLTKASFPNPEPIRGTIPGSINSTLDPGLIRRKSDGKLFLYTTPNDLTVFTASSLYGPWTKEPNTALYNYGEEDLGPGNHGAPSLHHLDDLYYLFYNGHDGIHAPNHDGQIGVATSSTLEPGSWDISAGYLDITWSASYNILDPTLLPKNDTRGHPDHLLGFGSYRNGSFNIPLADNLQDIPAPSDTANTAFNSTGRHDIEGSYQFYHNGWYYLFFSSGDCCKRSGEADQDPEDWEWSQNPGDVYKVMVCRSEEPRGGFVDREGRSCLEANGGTLVLGTHDNVWAPGGQGVLADEEVGGVVLYYHYVVADRRNDQDVPYRFGWNKLDFSSGWPVAISA
ncbi:glycoside hydrolase family 43 protein [Zasmidium cellare ATCC 36951]|uniref:Endo-1,5-alpha-L-arabinanase A n=1 Tax=Zasmidium cellare ATCC 36951 TaxID=1080233 RepID=A0A6A6CL88_ZASCE|nr:glycoside hydrolase family 43 protein [Zasmidium cellare ATCC 36951]KAF2168017.1 glycoside hydrolase family 43 protein [Zasmidium cellare ATCC 36951]